MGLIRAAFQAAGGVLADQWKEYFACDAMGNDQLIVKGYRQTKGNNKGNDDIISNGSVIAVADGQVALIVEDGKVVEFAAEAGRFEWNDSTEPSMFTGNFFKGLVASFQQFGKRFTYGGDTEKKQCVYYVNIKEIMGNKFGTSTPMPYDDPYYNTALYLRYFGQYSFKITDPIIFYSSIAGNVTDVFDRTDLQSMCTDEFMTALDTSLAMCSSEGFKFSQLPMKQREIAKFMMDTLDEDWNQRRGLQVVAVALTKVSPDDKSRERIETFDTNVMHSDPSAMAGGMAYAQMQAMQNAAKNDAGAMTGFMGFGMAQNATGGAQSQETLLHAANNLKGKKADSRAASAPAPIEDSWTCSCGVVNTGKFCSECGEKKPIPKPKANNSWTCSCGAVNTGRFCSECGAKQQPTVYKCTCGYTSEKPFKFCPECGEAL